MKHNHVTRDIKPPGECPACDSYWADEEPPQIAGAVVLQKDDKVLIALSAAMTDEMLHRYKDTLAGSFPGIEFVVTSAVTGVLVQRGT